MSELLEAARQYAVEMHEKFKHKRSNGEPYWNHPRRVVETLAAHGVDERVQAAGWLHDVPEDCAAVLAECEALLAEIERRFGREVAGFTREVTNFFGAAPATMEEKQQRLIDHAPHLSAGAKWIKLSDRLDNISDMTGWPDEKQKRYARATVRLLAALAPFPPGAEALAAEIQRRAEAWLAGEGGR